MSLAQEYIQGRKQKRKVIEVETTNNVLGTRALALAPADNDASTDKDDTRSQITAEYQPSQPSTINHSRVPIRQEPNVRLQQPLKVFCSYSRMFRAGY